jgi:DNA-binding NtrC family response regulator
MAKPLKILIVDDDPPTVDLLQQELDHLGHEMVSCSDGQKALQKIVADGSEYGFPGVLVADIRMPRIDGLELMKRTLKHDPALPVILITAYGDITMAVQAMHDGAYDFIEKPIAPERLSDVVRRALEKRSLVMENRALRAALASKFGMDTRIIGNSPSIVKLRESIANLADTEASVLILGETGTGKELVARCLHDFGSRAKYRFVPVNCGAIPENIFESELFGNEPGAFTDARLRIGRLEYGHKGTVFFDEIESMPQQLQVKLLRALEEHVVERLGSNEQIPVNFRVISATKADLSEAIKSGEFREDLYFRLNVAEVFVPPLRDRREDIPLLFQFFAEQFATRYERKVPGLSGSDFQELMAHTWPGNLRELRNVAERAVLGLSMQKGSVVELIHQSAKHPFSLPAQVDTFEKCIIEQSLVDHDGNIQSTMEDLGIPRRTLNEKMRKYGLERKDYL